MTLTVTVDQTWLLKSRCPFFVCGNVTGSLVLTLTTHTHSKDGACRNPGSVFHCVFVGFGISYITKTPSINADLLTFPDQLHSVPIAQMGNYQDFLKSAPQPLRDADPEQPKRLHTFGNPFKLDKKARRTHPCALC